MKKYIKELRIHHYVKNLLVFVALVCSGQFLTYDKFIHGLYCFLAFCMISSSVYVFNDIQDIEKDKIHPVKCKRPIASGAISINKAWILFFLLCLLGFFFNHLVFSTSSTILLILYLLLNIAYSLGLKNIPILDITILASGFLIRILYGTIVTNIEVSGWLYLTVIASAFYFALGKRRNELKKINDGSTRKVLSYYSKNFLDNNMYMCLGLANTFYALWTIDKKSIGGLDKYLIWTVPLVLIIFMKYSLDVEGDSDGDPVEVLIHDKTLIVLCAIYVTVMCCILYI